MPGFVWDQFETSLPMSTYLVAMLVADFTYLESPPELSSTRFRIWSRPDAIRQAEYAFFACPTHLVLNRAKQATGNVVLPHLPNRFLFCMEEPSIIVLMISSCPCVAA